MQPPLISLANIPDLKRTLLSTGDFSRKDEDTFDKLVAAKLPPLVSPSILGIILGISPKLITAMAWHPRPNYPYYRSFQLAKKSGGKRTILAPRRFLKAVQKYILHHILERQPLPPCVIGFVRKKSIVDNASIHVGAAFILNVDVKDFFPSVREKQATAIFAGIGFPKGMSQVLSRLCTFNGSLPQGAPTSPYLANLAFSEVDQAIMKLAHTEKLKYSRYADDLTFSGPRPMSNNFLTRLTKILSRYGFVLNSKKTRFAKPGQTKYVTGFVVNERVQPRRVQRRRIRAMFHNASLHPRKFREEAAVLLGWSSFVHTYDKAKGNEYLGIAQKVAEQPKTRGD